MRSSFTWWSYQKSRIILKVSITADTETFSLTFCGSLTMWRKTNTLIFTRDTSSEKPELWFMHSSWNPTKQLDFNQWRMSSEFLLTLSIDNFQNWFQPEDFPARLTRSRASLKPIQAMNETSTTNQHWRKATTCSTKFKNSQEPLMCDSFESFILIIKLLLRSYKKKSSFAFQQNTEKYEQSGMNQSCLSDLVSLYWVEKSITFCLELWITKASMVNLWIRESWIWCQLALCSFAMEFDFVVVVDF